MCEVITGANGNGLSVSDLRIQFKVTKTIYRTPNPAEIKIFNLNQSNENLIKGEFDEVRLNAGYQGSVRLVFDGNISRTFNPREGNDRLTQIIAADGDKDFKLAIVNFTLAAGTTGMDLVTHVLANAFTTVVKGTITLQHDKQRLRARVFSGMARKFLDELAAENDAHWSIQNGALYIIPVTSTLPNEAIVLRSDTGMLGAPTINDKGIVVRCLLNPDIVPNGKIWLDNNDLLELARKQRDQRPGAKHRVTTGPKKGIPRLDPDGIYKCFKVIHDADNRGPKWESEVHCVALDAKIPAGREAA